MRDSGKFSAAAILIGCCAAHVAVLLSGAVSMSMLAGSMNDALFPALVISVMLATYAVWRRRRRKKP